MYAWTRSWYAKCVDVYFQFEYKKHRDYFVKRYDFEKVSAKEAYDHYEFIHRTDYHVLKEALKIGKGKIT